MLVNPAAARGGAVRRLAAVLASSELEVRFTGSPAETEHEARRAADEGLDRLLVAGGDGTLHHAVRGLAGTSCALGIIPCGGGNDLARALAVEPEPRRALRRALEAPPRRIDVGRVAGLCFAGVLGLGIDDDVNRRVRAAPRWLSGRAAYAWATLLALPRFRAPWVRVDYEGGAFEGRVLLVALANSPFFGGGMHIAPAARLEDGWLDLVIVEHLAPAAALRLFPRVYRGRHVAHPAVHHRRVRGARLRSEPPRAIWADGERIGESRPEGTPIDLWPGSLAVLA
jgi:diacylglycerol kinase (ATP)